MKFTVNLILLLLTLAPVWIGGYFLSVVDSDDWKRFPIIFTSMLFFMAFAISAFGDKGEK